MALKERYSKFKYEVGCDEAGRGCMAGAVFAGAVILPKNFNHKYLNDSKKLTQKQRLEIEPIIKNESLSWAVSNVEVQEIDKINILNSSIKAMNLSIEKLKIRPLFLIIDGNRFNTYLDIPFKCIIKGDSLYKSIAAASILAKTARDRYMIELHNEYPEYNWINNMGYATLEHRNAIMKYGLSKYHRKSFHLKNQLNLF